MAKLFFEKEIIVDSSIIINRKEANRNNKKTIRKNYFEWEGNTGEGRENERVSIKIIRQRHYFFYCLLSVLTHPSKNLLSLNLHQTQASECQCRYQ